MTDQSEGDLQVWWIPQVPGEAFTVAVADYDEAEKLMQTLAAYDTFQFEHHIKPDYSNVGGLHVWEAGEWVECYENEWTERDV